VDATGFRKEETMTASLTAIKIAGYSDRLRRISIWLSSALIAVALAMAVQVKQAKAGDWVLPALAGVVVGAAVAHHADRYHYGKRYHSRYYAKHPRYKRYHRPYHRVYYPAPVVVVPMPFIGIYTGW
jgi:hypothetical protein